MADPYSTVAITGYNSNPPADDGSQVQANRLEWSTIKTKLNDPVKSRTDDMDTAIIAAFGKVLGGAGITSTAISYTVLSTDQGKLVRGTASGITITTPDATDVDAPFVFLLLNDSTGDITLDGSGSQTIDGDATVTVPANCGLILSTDGSNWFTGGQNFQRSIIRPQGYLTLINVATQPTSPFPASDQSAKTAVYYRPDGGNLLPIPNGTLFAVREFSELTLTLNSNHVANGIYDVFAFDDSGTIRLGTGPVWTTVTAGSCARGTGAGTTELDLLKGLLVNKVDATFRNGSTTYSVLAKNGIYLGSIFIDGSAGKITCHVSYGQSRKWGVWNAYNRRDITMRAGDSSAAWSYQTNTVRAANNSSANSITVFQGLPEEIQHLSYQASFRSVIATGQTGAGQIGIGYNSTTANSATTGLFSCTNANTSNHTVNPSLRAEHDVAPALGINVVTALENGLGSTSGTGPNWNGSGATTMLLAARYRG